MLANINTSDEYVEGIEWDMPENTNNRTYKLRIEYWFRESRSRKKRGRI
jgi:hypothetical protein